MEYGNDERATKELREAVRIGLASRDAWQPLAMAQIAMGKQDAAMGISRAACKRIRNRTGSFCSASLLDGQRLAEALKNRENLLKKLPRAPSNAVLKNRYKDQ